MAIGLAWGDVSRVGPGLYRIDLRPGIFTVRAVEGLEKLVYEVLYNLFTSLEAIPDDPATGSLLPAYLGRLALDPRGALAKSRDDLAFEVIRVQDLLKARHAQTSLPASERLNSIVVDEVTINPNELSADLRIMILNEEMQAAFVQVPRTIQS